MFWKNHGLKVAIGAAIFFAGLSLGLLLAPRHSVLTLPSAKAGDDVGIQAAQGVPEKGEGLQEIQEKDLSYSIFHGHSQNVFETNGPITVRGDWIRFLDRNGAPVWLRGQAMIQAYKSK